VNCITVSGFSIDTKKRFTFCFIHSVGLFSLVRRKVEYTLFAYQELPSLLYLVINFFYESVHVDL